jgi:RNA polymerase sigma-70 factor (ECF subfamily)
LQGLDDVEHTESLELRDQGAAQGHPTPMSALPNGQVGPNADDLLLLERLRAGDEAAFEVLVRTYGGRMLAVARRILPLEEDARDAVQEAFVSAFKALASFNATARISTWLHRITVNAALMRIRSRNRRPETPIEDLLPAFQPDGHHEEQFAQWSEPVDVALERRQTCAQVREAIAMLPESYRTVLMLRDIEEMDTGEVAALLGITPNAVKIRLHRARQALRTLIDPYLRGSGA